jgi:DNA-binding transcriptional regulator LsrR (DeoR family)
MARVSALYYLHDRTQQQIAAQLGISRPTVSRLLGEARAAGVALIALTPPTGVLVGLETELEDAFGLRAARVVAVESDRPREWARREVAAAAATDVVHTAHPWESIGVAWGALLDAMVHGVPPTPVVGARVVQAVGSIGSPDAPGNPAVLVHTLARLLGAAPVLLPAPAVVASPEVREALARDAYVAEALAQLAALDTVYVEIGGVGAEPGPADDAVVPCSVRDELRAAGAVGHIALCAFDAAGTLVQTGLDQRVLGVTAGELRRARRVVALASGPECAAVVAAALRTRLVHALVTDEPTARAVIALAATHV